MAACKMARNRLVAFSVWQSQTMTVQQPPSSDTCTPVQLANYLAKDRFGNVKLARQFLQTALDHIPSESSLTTTTPSSDDWGNPLLEQPMETSLLTPRAGKVQIQFYSSGYLVATQIKNPAIQLVVPPTSISHVILFAKPEDCKLYQELFGNPSKKKHPNAHLALLPIHKDKTVTFQNKPVAQLCFALPWNKAQGPLPPTPGSGSATAAWRQVFENCLQGEDDLVVVQVPPPGGLTSSPFRSFQSPNESTTDAGMPYVRCYHGVQDGVLYPLEEGLLFYKPARFLPRSELQSIQCGRGGGGSGPSSSRYVDMIIQLEDSETEFTNIQREELAGLNQYIHQVLIPAMQKDVQTTSATTITPNKEEQHEEHETDSEDDDDDEDDEAYEHGDEEEEEEEEESDNECVMVENHEMDRQLVASAEPATQKRGRTRSQAQSPTSDDDFRVEAASNEDTATESDEEGPPKRRRS